MRVRQLTALLSAIGLFLSVASAQAVSLIRDTEIEATLRSVASPLYKAAGLSNRSRIFIVNDTRMNAFVTGSNSIFLNAGIIQRLEEPEMLQAVIAHEIGHILGGHVAQRRDLYGSARTAAGLGLLLSVAAALAGEPAAGAGIAAGTVDATRKNVLAYTRAQEATADKTGARLMAQAGIDPEAAMRVMQKFAGQELMSSARQDPYARTHPLSRERVASLKLYANSFKLQGQGNPQAFDYWYARAVAKFDGFLGNPTRILRNYKGQKTEAAALARAIAYHRQPKPRQALREINALIKARPDDPYYHELKGQFLLESGKAMEAIPAYRTAVRLKPDAPLILAGLGRALVALNTSKANAEGLMVLKAAYAKDPRDPRMLRNLALAYARDGQNGMASVATAERYAIATNFAQAKIHATRAQAILPRGSSGWLKADDILGTVQQYEKRKAKR